MTSASSGAAGDARQARRRGYRRVVAAATSPEAPGDENLSGSFRDADPDERPAEDTALPASAARPVVPASPAKRLSPAEAEHLEWLRSQRPPHWRD